MSDDEADLELLALLRKSLGLDNGAVDGPAETRVLESAEYVYDNSIDVAIDMHGTKAAAVTIWRLMQEKQYSCKTWSQHELHPKLKNTSTVDFIFVLDLLNFCFWSESNDEEQRFAIEYKGKKWMGYWSLVAALQRALEEGIPITSPNYWVSQCEDCLNDIFKHAFRSATLEEIPLLDKRINCIREAGQVLADRFDGTFISCIEEANGSAAALVNLLVNNFPCFRDEARFEGKTVRFYKRAQILVADLWACFEGESYGNFHDVDRITMFADYRIPQMLHSLGCLQYSPPLDHHIRQAKLINSGDPWEVQLRGCSIWCVELIRRQIVLHHPKVHVNAILIDFFLYDTMKEQEANGVVSTPHHRTRCIWY